jgi:hypothetical protein
MKQSKLFAGAMLVVSLMLASMASKAQNSIELSCRAKAKEVAIQAYDGCVTEARTTKLIEIRDGYKSEMSEVKSKYDRMLKELKGEAPAAPAASKASTGAMNAAPAKKAAKTAKATKILPAKAGRAERPTAGIAQKLPAKMNDNGPALPIQNISEEMPVIAATSAATSADTSTGSDFTDTPESEIIDPATSEE